MDAPRLRRGLILHALHAQSPMALMRPALDRQVGVFYIGDDRQLSRDLLYLEQKGALTRRMAEVTVHHAAHQVEALTITPTGTDLVEGTTTDPGIEFARGG